MNVDKNIVFTFQITTAIFKDTFLIMVKVHFNF